MTIAWWLLGLLLAWFWWSRLSDAVRGFRSVDDIAGEQWNIRPQPAPRVSIIVPGRNEAESVERCLQRLISIDYPDFEIIAINDRSTDATGILMDGVALGHTSEPKLQVLHIRELPPGWMGKQHAMWQAAQRATGDWLLFTDADVSFHPEVLRRAVAYAEAKSCDHLVVFPSYCLRLDEQIFMAGFQMLFILGHRPWKVADPKAPDWIGLGPFNMVRRSAYEKVGTWEALKMEVIEDMKLGKLIKQNGLSQRNVYGPGLLPWRWGKGALGISRNLAKNMFALLAFRWGKATGALALMLAIFLLPLAGVIWAPSWAKLPYAAALACLAGLYVGMGKRTPVPAWTFLVYPLSVLMIAATLLRSMAHAAWHRGVVWRGTHYKLEELRKGWV